MSTPANLLTAALLIEIPKAFPQVRIWRQNTGAGIGMSTVKQAIALLQQGRAGEAANVLRSRPIKWGIEGAGDLSGVIGPHGRRLEIEVKVGKDRQSPEQRAFQAMIERAGGVYLIAATKEQALKDLGQYVFL